MLCECGSVGEQVNESLVHLTQPFHLHDGIGARKQMNGCADAHDFHTSCKYQAQPRFYPIART